MLRSLKMVEIKTMVEQILPTVKGMHKEMYLQWVPAAIQSNCSSHKKYLLHFSSVPCSTVHIHWRARSQQEVLHQWMLYYFKTSLKLNSMKWKTHRILKPWLQWSCNTEAISEHLSSAVHSGDYFPAISWRCESAPYLSKRKKQLLKLKRKKKIKRLG